MRYVGLVVCLLVAPGVALAGGQFAGDNGSQGMQRAGAFAAKANDPTALYYNPAALYKAGRRQLFVGVNVVSFYQSFDRAGQYDGAIGADGSRPEYYGDDYPVVEHQGDPQPIPFLAFTFPMDKLALGIGVFAPHGYGKRSYPDQVQTRSGAVAPAPQRYDTVDQSGVIVFPSVGLAYQLSPELSVGGRFSYGFAQLESRKFAQGIPNDAENPGQDTDAAVAVEDNEVLTFGVGMHYHPTPSFELAATYTAPVEINARGTTAPTLGADLANAVPGMVTEIVPVADTEARCAAGGEVGAIKTCVDLALPQTATVGMRWIRRGADGRELGDLELDVRWENWAAVDQYRVVMDGRNSAVDSPVNETLVKHGYQDVYSVRLGGSTVFARDGRDIEVRYGVAYDTATSPVSWTRLDVDVGERFTAAAGISLPLGSMTLDIGAAYIDTATRIVVHERVVNKQNMDDRVQPDVTTPLLPPDEQPYHPFNEGTYESHYWVASLGLRTSW